MIILKRNLNSLLKNENGMMIVEATVVFPVMFLVIFLMLVAGNAYLQKCRVEAFANKLALQGASYCADTMLKKIESDGIPGLQDVHTKPYRYFIGGMNDTVSEISDDADGRIRGMSTGLFSGMKPVNPIVDVQFNNHYIYSTFSVDLEYKVQMPVRLLFEKNNISMDFHTRADYPVSDSVEFIRNVDMADDYLERTGVKDKIKEYIEKAKEWFNR